MILTSSPPAFTPQQVPAAKGEELKTLARDAGDFFSLPLLRAAWEKTKQFEISGS